MVKRDLNKEYPHLKEFFPYLGLLEKESDRGKVLISCGFLEEQLKQVLRAFMLEVSQAEELVEGGNAPLGTFNSRITACYVFGLLTQREHDDLHLIRKIRNDFAHDIHTTFQTESVVNRCRELTHKAHDYGTVVVEPSGQFTTAAVALIMNLANRPHYVSKEKRTSKAWQY